MTKSLLFTIQIAGHIAYMVLIPLLALGMLGLWADERFHTLPVFLLVAVAIAFILTILWIKRSLAPIIERNMKQ